MPRARVVERQASNTWLPGVTQVLRDAFDRFVPASGLAREDFVDTVVHVHEVADAEPSHAVPRTPSRSLTR